MSDFGMKCNTCMAAFPSLEAIKEHYRGDWHVVNSKRRAQNMAPLRREQYLAIAKTLPAKPNTTRATPSSSSSNSTKAATAVLSASHKTAPVPSAMSVPEKNHHEEAAVEKKENKSKKDEEELDVESVGEEEEEGEEEGDWEDVDTEDEEEDEEGANKPDVKLGNNISIFDDKEFPSTEDCLEYMAKTFGFFIPDTEYLVDLEGMVEYLGEKVKLGGICLYCQKRFASGRACQHHMIGKSHCKIAYEDGVDTEEFEDFYDFSASYEDLDKVEVDENGDVIQEEVEVASTGELVLPDGRILGHRNFRLYYKQYYRPEDTRAPVLAQQREELLRLGLKFGGTKASEVSNLSDTEVMSMLVKYHKQVRKSQIVEQQAQHRRASADMRREYKSKLHKMRSSATTTDKIRDYHGILK